MESFIPVFIQRKDTAANNSVHVSDAVRNIESLRDGTFVEVCSFAAGFLERMSREIELHYWLSLVVLLDLLFNAAIAG
jgi:hypothetical protein